MTKKLLSTLRSLANAILGRTGKPDRVDTATRMAMDADFSARGEPPMSQPEPGRDVDPIDELIRIVGEREMEPPRRPKVLPFQRRRRGR
jgi:hypothetical protein